MTSCKYLTVYREDAVLIHSALRERLRQVERDFEILSRSSGRDLTPEERDELPSTLQELSRELLREQIDPWWSLVLTYQDLCSQFDPDTF